MTCNVYSGLKINIIGILHRQKTNTCLSNINDTGSNQIHYGLTRAQFSHKIMPNKDE